MSYIWRVTCPSAKRYKALRAPKCGCQTCHDLFNARLKALKMTPTRAIAEDYDHADTNWGDAE